MAKLLRRQNLRNLLRFYGFALPYWKLVLLSFAMMFAYSAVSAASVGLLKPILEAFDSPVPRQRPDRGAAVHRAEDTPAEDEAQAEAGPFAGFDRWKARTKERLLGLGPVKRSMGWLWPGGQASLKRVAIALALCIGPIFLISGFFQEYLRGRVVWSVLADIRLAVFESVSNLSLSYFGHQRRGELLSRLTHDVTHTGVALKVIFGKLILQPLMLLFFISGAALASLELTLAGHIVAPIVFLSMGRFGRQIRRYAVRSLEKLADVTDSVTQMLNGIRVVKSFNMEEAEKDEFHQRNREQVRRAFKLVRNEALANVLPQFLMGIVAACLTLLLADYLLGMDRLTIGSMGLCCTFMLLESGRMRRIVAAYNDLQRASAGVSRVFELIDLRPDIQDSPDAVDIAGVTKGIRFDHVWFAYEETPVLTDVSLFVPCGKTYAIVGATGAGKSTMLDLIPRFYDTLRGSVTIDGLDVRTIKRRSLMQQIAIVGQQPFLFNRSIAENIRYGRPNATDDEVAAAARAANIHDFILSLPEAYETAAGETGDRLSGGQRQCITIARAILKDAPILILDEATSSLDAESEMLVQRALENLMADRTTLVIAHRLSTVRHAHRIVVLKDGCIVEEGTHEELLELEGEYCRLYRLQFAPSAAKGG
ncbi:MAG: ABC transporter ATP-binding protein [Planctomycetota bacterium]|jgi:subfamily B ATP-binding cassette protein MsbA